MKIPDEFNYISASLTLRCTLGCSYCINTMSGVDRTVEELSGEQWVAALNDWQIRDDLPITLEGGEPSLHKDFYYIVNNLKHDVNVLTNLSFNEMEFIHNVDPRKFASKKGDAFKSIRVSYHAERMDQDEIVEKARRLQTAGFPVGIFAISAPSALEQNITMAEKCRKSQLYFFIKDFLGEYHSVMFGYYRYPDAVIGRVHGCECRTNELLIAPDGKVYRCHRDMYKHESPIGNITDPIFEAEHRYRYCANFGLCNPCDVKMKTNRYLQAGNSSVEIRF